MTVLLALVALASPARAETLYAVELVPGERLEPGRVLAAELQAATQADATFLGVTAEGDVVLEFEPGLGPLDIQDRLGRVTDLVAAHPFGGRYEAIEELLVLRPPGDTSPIDLSGLSVLDEYERGGFAVVGRTGGFPHDLLDDAAASSQVRYLEPNFRYRAAALPAPNDDYWVNGQLPGMGLIAAPTAWEAGHTKSDRIVAVLDTGIGYRHPDLAANVWTGLDDLGNTVHGRDFVGAGDEDPQDEHGHGTHLAGTIGAVGDNDEGVVGVCWSVPLLAVRIYADEKGYGDADVVAKGIDYALAQNASVLNCSFGGPNPSQAIREAIERADQAGALVVAAAGNGDVNKLGIDLDQDPFYPACHDVPNILSVAAVEESAAPATFSNYGVSQVDLAAPGFYLYSCRVSSSGFPPMGYGMSRGTSMAAAHVSGAAALAWGAPKYAALDHHGIRDLLLDNARVEDVLDATSATEAVLDLSFLAPGSGTEQEQQRFAGILKHPVVAIGGETTGTVLQTAGGDYELEVPDTPHWLARLEALDGTSVVVLGKSRIVRGVQRKRVLIRVHRLEPE